MRKRIILHYNKGVAKKVATKNIWIYILSCLLGLLFIIWNFKDFENITKPHNIIVLIITITAVFLKPILEIKALSKASIELDPNNKLLTYTKGAKSIIINLSENVKLTDTSLGLKVGGLKNHILIPNSLPNATHAISNIKTIANN